MQFSKILLAALATASSTVMAAHCAIGNSVRTDCCWGGNDGYKSCLRQNSNRYFCEADTANYCTNVKGPNGAMVSTTCDADCCNTLNGWGTGCPK
ncbi:hypothetical protein CMEL01_09909 [Colletotrichum melonis]|uniref:Uncharacterized protein n=1 Tax=Colletotrichum melonis TaxID=1209925 RepID=A0AAI9TVR5_9PEZI|nr:hypothetical protein CMEL01_09909 [Colletotrichum melonis]